MNKHFLFVFAFLSMVAMAQPLPQCRGGRMLWCRCSLCRGRTRMLMAGSLRPRMTAVTAMAPRSFRSMQKGMMLCRRTCHMPTPKDIRDVICPVEAGCPSVYDAACTYVPQIKRSMFACSSFMGIAPDARHTILPFLNSNSVGTACIE